MGIERLIKIRKTVHCQHCGKELLPGTMAYRWQPFHRSARYWCEEHKPTRSETTESSYLQALYGIVDTEIMFDDISEAEDVINDLHSQIEELRDSQQEIFDNIPEQLQYGPVATTIQEHIDKLDQALSDLEDIDDFDEPENDYVRDTFEEEQYDANYDDCTEEEFKAEQDKLRKEFELSEDENAEAHLIDLIQEKKDEIIESIQEALSSIDE